MRIARNFAALVALATVGFAVGDFATDPSALGAVALLALIAVFAFLLAYLFRPQGSRRRQPAAEPPREPDPEPERRARTKPQTVWTGWGAEEAQVAREQRRERRRRPSP